MSKDLLYAQMPTYIPSFTPIKTGRRDMAQGCGDGKQVCRQAYHLLVLSVHNAKMSQRQPIVIIMALEVVKLVLEFQTILCMSFHFPICEYVTEAEIGESYCLTCFFPYTNTYIQYFLTNSFQVIANRAAEIYGRQ